MGEEPYARDQAGRLNVTAQIGGVALLHAPSLRAVGLQAPLVDPATNAPTGEVLLIQMDRRDAWTFAQAVLALAKERHWGFPEDVRLFDRPGHPKGMN
jgi:hypothetical protein